MNALENPEALNTLLDMLELITSNNAESHAATVDETLRASRSLALLRVGIARGRLDAGSVLLAIYATIDAFGPMMMDAMSRHKGLHESDLRRAKATLGPDATDEQVADELGKNVRTLRRVRAYIRKLDNVPARKGRPKALKK